MNKLAFVAVVATSITSAAIAISPYSADFPSAVAPATDGSGAAATAPGRQILQAQTFNLSDVRLIPDEENHFAAAQDLNTKYLKYLDADRLLYTFRTINGLPQHQGAQPYGGWINPAGHDELVNGHFTGHFLSALAFTAASTGDPAILAKSKYMVAELGKCQEAWCKKNASECGYLSAYHISQIYALEQHQGGTWATYYTLHKIMAGLLDLYENTDNAQALQIVTKMADFIKKRVDHVIVTQGWAWWELCLQVEFGGMNEVAYNLFAITGDPAHKTLGDYFYKAAFMDPLAAKHEFALTGQHANTHLPEIIGIARGWELTGNSTLSEITTFFYDILSRHYTYSATGGSNQGEHWLYPDTLGTAIATTPGHDSAGACMGKDGAHDFSWNRYHTEESCTQYNVLKILRHLFRWAPSAAIGDDYELKITNGVIGIQKPEEIGTMVYMTPLGNGVARPKANWGEGWGSKNASFWCCYGTAIESFSKLGDSLYFHEDTAGAQQLWVVQYVSSVVRWRAAGLNLTQRVRHDMAKPGVALVSTITVGALEEAQPSKPGMITISIRIPAWAAEGATSVSLNGESIVKPGSAGKNGTFLMIKRAFKAGDVVTARFGMHPYFRPLNDNRTAYATMGSIHYGPYLLVALSNASYALKADIRDISSWLTRDTGTTAAGALRFTAKGSDGVGYTMMPLNRVADELYTAHLNVSTTATQCLCGDAESCDGNGGPGATPAGAKAVTLDAKTLIAVGGATVNTGMVRSGNPGQATAVLMQHPFIGKGTITGLKLSYSYTIGYNAAPGKNGSQIGVAWHPSLDLGQCSQDAPVTDPDAKQLYTSPHYLMPAYDKTHTYSSPVNVSLSGLALDVSKPGARLGLTFEGNDHNMQVLLPIHVEIEWEAAAHGHGHEH